MRVSVLSVLAVLLVLAVLSVLSVTFRFRKQKVYVVSFAHDCCQKAQKNLEKTALGCGVDKVFSLNLESLDAPENVKQFIRDNKRGAGFWCWKPFALKQILKRVNKGDIVIYVDASTYFTRYVDKIVDFINTNEVLVFKHKEAYLQSTWTKMNAVEYFGYDHNWCETEGTKIQMIAAFVGIKNDSFGNFIVDEWLKSMNPENSKLFDDSPSARNCLDFKESRHDQQMLSLIVYKYLDHSVFADYDKSKYGWVWQEDINGNDRHD